MASKALYEGEISPWASPIEYVEDNGCWICLSHKRTIRRDGKKQNLRHYVYNLLTGKTVREGKNVIMQCAEVQCIKPEHMAIRPWKRGVTWTEKERKRVAWLSEHLSYKRVKEITGASEHIVSEARKEFGYSEGLESRYRDEKGVWRSG